MRIDLRTARMCSQNLKSLKAKMENILESTKRLHIELACEERESLEALAQQLYEKIRELEDEITQLKSMIVALDGIISVYDKTERKTAAHISRIGHSRKGVPQIFISADYVPRSIWNLFGQSGT